jgi:hypothetical protein
LAEAAEFLVEISAWPAVVIEPAPADNLGGSIDFWAFRPIRGVIARIMGAAPLVSPVKSLIFMTFRVWLRFAKTV